MEAILVPSKRIDALEQMIIELQFLYVIRNSYQTYTIFPRMCTVHAHIEHCAALSLANARSQCVQMNYTNSCRRL